MSPRDHTPEPLTDAELDRLAEINLSDVKSAQSAWRRDAPTQYRNLLDAEVPDPDADNDSE